MAEMIPNLLERQPFRDEAPCTCMSQRVRTKTSGSCADSLQSRRNNMTYSTLANWSMR